MSYLNQTIFKVIYYTAMHLNKNIKIPAYCTNNALCLTRIYENPQSGDDPSFNITDEMLKYIDK